MTSSHPSRTRSLKGPTRSSRAPREHHLTPHEELQLIEAHRRGDNGALGTLLQAYQRRVYTVCYRMLRNADEAADITQDALVKLLEHLDSYDGRAKFSTWVIRITINCCISHLRRKKVRQATSLDADLDGGSDASAGRYGEIDAPRELSAHARVERDEARAVLHEALMSLEPDARAILVLRDMQGLEYEQLACALDLPVGTVKSRLFRARAALRGAIDRLCPDTLS